MPDPRSIGDLLRRALRDALAGEIPPEWWSMPLGAVAAIALTKERRRRG